MIYTVKLENIDINRIPFCEAKLYYDLCRFADNSRIFDLVTKFNYSRDELSLGETLFIINYVCRNKGYVLCTFYANNGLVSPEDLFVMNHDEFEEVKNESPITTIEFKMDDSINDSNNYLRLGSKFNQDFYSIIEAECFSHINGFTVYIDEDDEVLAFNHTRNIILHVYDNGEGLNWNYYQPANTNNIKSLKSYKRLMDCSNEKLPFPLLLTDNIPVITRNSDPYSYIEDRRISLEIISHFPEIVEELGVQNKRLIELSVQKHKEKVLN